jgi:hypothetical protein
LLKWQVVYSRAKELLSWMEQERFYSHDWYDACTTPIGKWLTSKVYSGERPNKIARLVYLPFAAVTRFIPELVAPVTKKTKAATTVALAATTYFLLYRHTNKKTYAKKGETCLKWLLTHRSKGYSGYCWGLPFDWQLPKGILAPAGTPCSTIMIYMMDAFKEGYEVTGNERYKQAVLATKNFFLKDLNYDKVDENTVASSYTPLDRFHVINASSYVAASLYRIYELNQENSLRELADKLIGYVLKEQNSDGSWYYWGAQERMHKGIDSLHQCYIIENLHYCESLAKNLKVKRAIDKAVSYFNETFLTNRNIVRKFPSNNAYFELIDQAEAITMFVLLGDEIKAASIAEATFDVFSMAKKPYFYSAITPIRKIGVPYMRWGQAQMAYALTLLFSALKRDSS